MIRANPHPYFENEFFLTKTIFGNGKQTVGLIFEISLEKTVAAF